MIVAGMEKTSRAIGRENGLLWHVPEDLKRFKALTLGHPVIMGRKTYESIVESLGTPLPGRTNIVITKQADYVPPGDKTEAVKVVASLEEALEVALAEHPTEIHIGGGADIYRQAFPLASQLYLTFFDDPSREGDTFFPDFNQEFTAITKHEPAVYNGITYQWVDYTRKH